MIHPDFETHGKNHPKSETGGTSAPQSGPRSNKNFKKKDLGYLHPR